MAEFIHSIKYPSQKSSSLPPLKVPNLNQRIKPLNHISKRLSLFFKLRNSSMLVINDPIECLLPSNLSKKNYSSVSPTAADVVMSSKPPVIYQPAYSDLKYSRLNEASPATKRRKDNSFLNKSFKANEKFHDLAKIQKKNNPLPPKIEKNIRKDNIIRKSIPFLSEIINNSCKDSSKMFISINLYENSNTLNEYTREKESSSIILENASTDIYRKTANISLQTEDNQPEEKNKRRVVYNKNSSHIFDGSNDADSLSDSDYFSDD